MASDAYCVGFSGLLLAVRGDWFGKGWFVWPPASLGLMTHDELEWAT